MIVTLAASLPLVLSILWCLADALVFSLPPFYSFFSAAQPVAAAEV